MIEVCMRMAASTERRIPMPRRAFERSTPATGNIIDMSTGKPVEVPSIPILCERIRHYRIQMGIGQKELARRIGITGNSVCNWENGLSPN